MKLKYIVLALLAVGSLALGQKPKSAKEAEAVKAVLSAKTADDRIAAADNLLSKFKDTEFKSIALMMAAQAYDEKHDTPNAIVYGNRALEADPKNFQVMLIVSGDLAQMTKEFDLDKDEKLKRSTKLANDAIVAVTAAAKPNPSLSDDQWAAIQKDLIAQAHETLGVIASIDKKWDVAIAEFRTAVDNGATPEPVTMIRLTVAYNNAKKYDEANAMADKVLATPGAPDNLKKMAQDEKARAAKLRAQP
jgi:tetratricopeptide (TPR) repeat protein